MYPPARDTALREVARLLERLVGKPVRARPLPAPQGLGRADAFLEAGRFRCAVRWRAGGAAAPVEYGAIEVSRYAFKAGPGVLPLLAVPYMGETGAQQCLARNVSWIDLCGNAVINTPSLRVRITGNPSRFKRSGRPSSVFAPKSSRVARWLLIHQGSSVTQGELARAVGLGKGFVSRIVSRLCDEGLVRRLSGGRLSVADPDLLLTAWREADDFQRHSILAGHVASKSGEDLMHALSAASRGEGIRPMFTGLAAAWVFAKHAGFRLVTAYVPEWPAPSWLDKISFRENSAGANLWLVVPRDEGVLDGRQVVRGVTCVHPVQAFVDLKGHPERAREAADQLKNLRLTWRTDAKQA